MKIRWFLALASTGAALLACGGNSADPAPEVRVLSSDASRITGESVLVEVPTSLNGLSLKATLNGTDVSSSFVLSDSGTYRALLAGLRVGANTLKVSTQASDEKTLTLTARSSSTPLFAGPKQQPFVCQTQSFGLAAATDADCNAPTVVSYVYRSSSSQAFKPFDPSVPLPADLAQTTTTEGNVLPYIVRVETGTVRRAVYQIAFLHQPGTTLPSPWKTTKGWNGRMVYSFGGGCTSGYRQGTTTGGVPEDVLLGDYPVSRGYAAVSSSLNVFGTNCNDVISAEATASVKEVFSKTYGVPKYTIGNGASGGSMQQHLIALNYPGLLDGILPQLSFPDTLTFQAPLADCALIDRTLGIVGAGWTLAQKTAVTGAGVYDYCRTNGSTWVAQTLAAQNCNAVVPASSVYNPTTNRTGVRCTFQDNLVNVFGTDAATGFARRTLDNVGVQYGLAAVKASKISVDQFLDLNAGVGGFDIDGNIIAARTNGDVDALRLAYQTGQLNNGAGGLQLVPIIDVRPYWDASGNVHDSVRSATMRARLTASNGTFANQVLITTATVDPVQTALDLATPNTPYRRAVRDALDAMDAWLAAIARDQTGSSKAQKVINNKPAGLVDACYDLSYTKITDLAACRQLFPVFGNPRLAAGEPDTQDVLKCQLKGVSSGDYGQTLSAAQLQRLNAIFPTGVCDYSKAGIQQQPLAGLWLSYPQVGQFAPLPY